MIILLGYTYSSKLNGWIWSQFLDEVKRLIWFYQAALSKFAPKCNNFFKGYWDNFTYKRYVGSWFLRFYKAGGEIVKGVSLQKQAD